MTTRNWLRPSMLPKLALCAHYRSEATAGAAAQRGTAMDENFREEIAASEETADEEEEFPDEASVETDERTKGTLVRSALTGSNVSVKELNPDDKEAVLWARDTARLLAGALPLEAREENLRIEAAGMTGTADLLCAPAKWSADLKSGFKRNYLEQQAVYALGFMDRYFEEEWTVYLLYCDQEEVERQDFTLESATKIVNDALEAVKAKASQPPTPNEYCGWCSRRFECPARREQVGIIPFDGPEFVSFDEISSDLLRDFVLRAGAVKDFSKKVRSVLMDRVVKGEKIKGVSITSRKGSEKIPPGIVGRYIKELGTENVLGALGAMSRKKFQEIWDRMMSGKPFPEEHVVKMPGSSFPRITAPKTTKVKALTES
jgi:hypothetical protein